RSRRWFLPRRLLRLSKRANLSRMGGAARFPWHQICRLPCSAAATRERMSPRRILTALVFALFANALPAADVRPVPPPGVVVPDADRAELEKGVAALAAEIAELRKIP